MSALADLVTEALEGLTDTGEGVILRPMLTLSDAIDFACSGLAPKSRADYSRLLYRFADAFPRDWDVAKVTEDDFVRYFARRGHLAKSTRAWEEKVFYSTFKKLYRAKKIKRNPMEFVPRTSTPDPESLDLVRISSDEVLLILSACQTLVEKLCLCLLVYCGPRRHAAAMARFRDYDQNGKRLRFHEKGGKTLWKPIPEELHELLQTALANGVYEEAARFYPEGTHPADWYLIPPEFYLVKKGDRCDRNVYRIVEKVAARAGVRAHTHSLRAAFADFCLDSGLDAKALQLLMGHVNPATTERYTKRYDKERRMEAVRSLSWQQRGDADSANSDILVGGVSASGGGRIRTSVGRASASGAGLHPTFGFGCSGVGE